MGHNRSFSEALVMPPHLVYSHLKVTDARGRVLPSRLAVVGGAVTIVFDDSGASYPVVIDTLMQLLPGTRN